MRLHLSQERCVACEGGVPPLSRTEAEELLLNVPGWALSQDATSLSRTYVRRDFKDALAFVNTVGALAEADLHHPDIHLTGWNKVRIDLSTHAINGLSRNDFILAAKIDA
jgi:4a-hydroxytetrahydrobiopterin dehydratase